jgi:prepilin-type N-terminal cleavage/methylation domain-containing protein
MKLHSKKAMDSAKGFTLVELIVAMVILVVVVGIVGSITITVEKGYVSQQALLEAQNNARVAMDMILRLVRMAGNNPMLIVFEPIHPDPDGNSLMDSIRLRSDWNPSDGDLGDRYEDMIFSTNNGVMYVKQPSDGSPVEFVDRIESLSFTYFDNSGNAIADPVASRSSIAYVDVELHTRVPDVPAMVFKSSAVVRTRE